LPRGPNGRLKLKPKEVPEALLWAMASVWNDVVRDTALSQVAELTDKRRTALRARISERWNIAPERQFRKYIALILQSPFLRGENDRGWRANFDWALRPQSIVDVAEGKFNTDGDQRR
jgi:hypothetical protein